MSSERLREASSCREEAVNQVLVVDHEVDMAATYERLLRRAGHRVVTTDSCAAGLRLLRSTRPKLVISDLHLPDGDGLDIPRAAAALEPAPRVIIVFVRASRAVRSAARAFGVNAFLSKPFSIADFSNLVEDVLRGPAARGSHS